MIKKILFLLLIPFTVNAGSFIENFDPTVAGSLNVLTITCVDPIEREPDASGVVVPLAVGEIVNRKFYIAKDGGAYIDSLADNPVSCTQTFDLSAVPDGSYVYAITAIDDQGRESLFSPDTVTAIVKRLANPNSPGITGVTRQ